MAAIVEHRNFGAKLEVRDAGEKPRLAGYAAKFNTLSRPLGVMRFREKIEPHAFDETLAGNADVRFTLNHDPNYVLGRTRAGTLRLSTDRAGLRFDLDVPDTARGRNLVASVKRGDISDCSFSFRTLDDHWSKDQDGSPIRTLKKVSLHDGDVAAVAYPAYPETEIGARAREQVEARGRELLGIRTIAELDLELARELEDFDVKAGPAMPVLYGYTTIFHRYGANVRKRATSQTRDCLLRGAFAESVGRDLITANSLGHDARVFGSTADGSLKLAEDEIGVRFEVRPSQFYRDEFQRLFEMTQRGQVQQMSIEYGVRECDSHLDLAKGVRFIHAARLYHVSPVFGGSFPGTYIRAGFGDLESIAAVEADARQRELQLAGVEG